MLVAHVSVSNLVKKISRILNILESYRSSKIPRKLSISPFVWLDMSKRMLFTSSQKNVAICKALKSYVNHNCNWIQPQDDEMLKDFWVVRKYQSKEYFFKQKFVKLIQNKKTHVPQSLQRVFSIKTSHNIFKQFPISLIRNSFTLFVYTFRLKSVPSELKDMPLRVICWNKTNK